MALFLVVVMIISTLEAHKIGFLLSASGKSNTALQNIASYSADNSKVTLVTEEYETTIRSIINACCRLVEAGVTAVVAKSTSTETAIQADYLSPLKIPLISVSATDPYLPTPSRDYLLRMAPSDIYQSTAIFDIIKHYQWKHVSILTSSDLYGLHGLMELQSLLIDEVGYSVDNVVLFFEHAMDISLELKKLKQSMGQIIVLNCAAEYGKLVLEAADTVGLMASGFVWIVTDAIAAQPEVLTQNGMYLRFYEGLIGVRLAVNKTRPYQDFKEEYLQLNHTVGELGIYALMSYDAIGLATSVLNSLPTLPTQYVQCTSTEGWGSGEQLMYGLLNANYAGITGITNFTGSGEIQRDDYDIVNFEENIFQPVGESKRIEYDIVNFKEDIFQPVGIWRRNSHLEITGTITFLGNPDDVPSGVPNNLTGRFLRLGIVHEGPFSFFKEGNCEWKDCWTGMCPDIVSRLSEDLGFTYNYTVPEDGKWGGYNKTTKKWNGMISELMSGKIDMITMHLSQNSAREEVIQFSSPIIDSSISAVLKEEGSDSSTSFFFFSALKLEVWLSVLVANTLVTLLVWLFSKVSPFDKSWAKVHAMQTCSCDECRVRKEKKAAQVDCLIKDLEKENEHGDISFYESLWLIGTGLVGQSGGMLPYSLPSRFLLFSWWFFMLFIINVYTANITAHLTLKSTDTSLDDIHDLLFQDEYQWGVIGSRHLETLLLSHTDTKNTRLVEQGVRLESLEEGLEKVVNGKFVFIDEGPVFAYQFRDNCDISFIGGNFQPFDYAFGLPKESPYASLINKQLLKYREEGLIQQLWEKWSPENEDCSSKLGDALVLDFERLSGLFYILAGTVFISSVMVCGEWIYATIIDSRRNPQLTYVQCLKIRLSIIKTIFCNYGQQEDHVENINTRISRAIEKQANTVVERPLFVRSVTLQ